MPEFEPFDSKEWPDEAAVGVDVIEASLDAIGCQPPETSAGNSGDFFDGHISEQLMLICFRENGPGSEGLGRIGDQLGQRFGAAQAHRDRQAYVAFDGGAHLVREGLRLFLAGHDEETLIDAVFFAVGGQGSHESMEAIAEGVVPGKVAFDEDGMRALLNSLGQRFAGLDAKLLQFQAAGNDKVGLVGEDPYRLANQKPVTHLSSGSVKGINIHMAKHLERQQHDMPPVTLSAHEGNNMNVQ